MEHEKFAKSHEIYAIFADIRKFSNGLEILYFVNFSKRMQNLSREIVLENQVTAMENHGKVMAKFYPKSVGTLNKVFLAQKLNTFLKHVICACLFA